MNKLLVTSQGFTNQYIIDALKKLLDRSISQSRIEVVGDEEYLVLG